MPLDLLLPFMLPRLFRSPAISNFFSFPLGLRNSGVRLYYADQMRVLSTLAFSLMITAFAIQLNRELIHHYFPYFPTRTGQIFLQLKHTGAYVQINRSIDQSLCPMGCIL